MDAKQLENELGSARTQSLWHSDVIWMLFTQSGSAEQAGTNLKQLVQSNDVTISAQAEELPGWVNVNDFKVSAGVGKSEKVQLDPYDVEGGAYVLWMGFSPRWNMLFWRKDSAPSEDVTEEELTDMVDHYKARYDD